MPSNTRSSMNGGPRLRPIRTLALASLLAALAGCAAAPEQPSAAAPALVGQPAAADARARAAEARAKGDNDTALRLYIEAAEHDPEDAESMYAIGSLYDERPNGAALAARAYARAVQIDPQHAARARGPRPALFRRSAARAGAPVPEPRRRRRPAAMAIAQRARPDRRHARRPSRGRGTLRGGARRESRLRLASQQSRLLALSRRQSRRSRARLPRRARDRSDVTTKRCRISAWCTRGAAITRRRWRRSRASSVRPWLPTTSATSR